MGPSFSFKLGHKNLGPGLSMALTFITNGVKMIGIGIIKD
jgi:hypothetical protein